MVSRVVTPRETLAGTALGSSQKLTWQLDLFLQMSNPFSRIHRSRVFTQETMTSIQQGT